MLRYNAEKGQGDFMNFKLGLDFQWKRADSDEDPSAEHEEVLMASAVRQAAFDILKGEADGKLTEWLLQDGKAVDYVGTWRLEGKSFPDH